MPDAIVISTWPFGQPANAEAWRVLASGGHALDAIQAGIVQCENDPTVDSVGFGGLPDASGRVTLDASIMDDRGRCGAVACVRRAKNPIVVARWVMERTPHVMLVGEGADEFAISHRMAPAELLSEAAAEKYRIWREANRPADSHDTIGMLAIDAAGRIAGGCSTSGLAYKLPGRVGDSPLIGAGLFVEPGVGAATATGAGEEMIRVAAAHGVTENMRRGMPPLDAIRDVLERIRARRGIEAGDVSLIALRADGEFAGMSLWQKTSFKFAVRTSARDDLDSAPTLT